MVSRPHSSDSGWHACSCHMNRTFTRSQDEPHEHARNGERYELRGGHGMHVDKLCFPVRAKGGTPTSSCRGYLRRRHERQELLTSFATRKEVSGGAASNCGGLLIAYGGASVRPRGAM
jgi:hypothetical protein